VNLLLAQAKDPTLASLLWAFLNSPVGVTVVSSVLLLLVGKFFTATPEREKVFETYKGLFFDAVRYAEKAIPDGSPNVAAARADAALKFALQLEPKLGRKKDVDVRAAINLAHAEVEKKDGRPSGSP
jgi:hypothetical protein